MAAATAMIVFAQEQDLNLCWQSGWGGSACRYQKNRKEQGEIWEDERDLGPSSKSRKVGGHSNMGRINLEVMQGNGHPWTNGEVNDKKREGTLSKPVKVQVQNGPADCVGNGAAHTGQERTSCGSGCAHEAELEDPEMDAPSDDATLARMAGAVRVLLQGLGEDLGRDGLIRTPLRVAKALRFATKGYRESVRNAVGTALFALPGSSGGGTVVVRDVDTFSHCRACLLPFRCRCHIAYVPGAECVVGLSKLARLAEVFSRRLQTPHRLAQDIADGLASVLAAQGVAVVVESWHISNSCEADCTLGASTSDWVPSVAAAASGCFCDPEEGLWDEFVAMLGLDPEVESRLEAPPEEGRTSSQRERDGLSASPELCPFGRPGGPGEFLVEWGLGEADSDSSGEVFSEIAELDEERPCTMHQDPERGARQYRRSASGAESANGGDAREAALPQMVAAVETLLRAAEGGDDVGMTQDDVSMTSERYARWLLSATRGSQQTVDGALTQRSPGELDGFSHAQCREQERVGMQERVGNWVSVGNLRVQGNGLGGGATELVTEIGVPLVSQCEHHLLPFLGKAHIGYVRGSHAGRLDRGQVEWIVSLYSQRLQVQERLTKQIAEAIASSTHAEGVIVVVEASHMCMMSRGIEKVASSTATTEVLGSFKTDPKARAAFLRKLPRRH